MTPSSVSQPLSNATANPGQGDHFVAKASAYFDGSDALIGFSGSAWSANGSEEITLQLWIDSEPVGTPLAMYANSGAMHLSLGHTWVHAQGIAQGQHTILVQAGPTTITDQNDTVSVTVLNMGDGLSVCVADDAACPSGPGQTLLSVDGLTHGGDQMLVAASSSGWVADAGQMAQTLLLVDGTATIATEVYCNNAQQHMATVPTTVVLPDKIRGEHQFQLVNYGATWTDGGDRAHLAVVEWIDPSCAPVVQALNPAQNDAQANAQQGRGGTIAQSTFSSNGGTLLICSHCSAWTPGTGQVLTVGIQVDHTSRGFMSVYANPGSTHMALVSNDLVVEGIGAGQHTLTLLGEANPYTDGNDRVSLTVLEFPPG